MASQTSKTQTLSSTSRIQLKLLTTDSMTSRVLILSILVSNSNNNNKLNQWLTFRIFTKCITKIPSLQTLMTNMLHSMAYSLLLSNNSSSSSNNSLAWWVSSNKLSLKQVTTQWDNSRIYHNIPACMEQLKMYNNLPKGFSLNTTLRTCSAAWAWAINSSGVKTLDTVEWQTPILELDQTEGSLLTMASKIMGTLNSNSNLLTEITYMEV